MGLILMQLPKDGLNDFLANIEERFRKKRFTTSDLWMFQTQGNIIPNINEAGEMVRIPIDCEIILINIFQELVEEAIVAELKAAVIECWPNKDGLQNLDEVVVGTNQPFSVIQGGKK